MSELVIVEKKDLSYFYSSLASKKPRICILEDRKTGYVEMEGKPYCSHIIDLSKFKFFQHVGDRKIPICPKCYKSIGKNKDVYTNSRVFWIEHIYRTRLFLLDAYMDARYPQTKQRSLQALDHLLKNQTDLATLFGTIVKSDTSKRELEKALVEHIQIAGVLFGILYEQKYNPEIFDKSKLDEKYKSWEDNAGAISDIISNYTSQKSSEIKEHMLSHLKLTAQEAVHIISEDYVKSIESFKEALIQIESMAKTFYFFFKQ